MATLTGSSNLSPSLETKCTTEGSVVVVAMLCLLGEWKVRREGCLRPNTMRCMCNSFPKYNA